LLLHSTYGCESERGGSTKYVAAELIVSSLLSLCDREE